MIFWLCYQLMHLLTVIHDPQRKCFSDSADRNQLNPLTKAPPRVIRIVREYTPFCYNSNPPLLHNLNVNNLGHLTSMWSSAGKPFDSGIMIKIIFPKRPCKQSTSGTAINKVRLQSFGIVCPFNYYICTNRSEMSCHRGVSGVWSDTIPSTSRVSLYRWDIWAQVLYSMRHSCAGFSKQCRGIFYKQGWSWSWRWGGVTCTVSGTGLILFYPSGQLLHSTWI